jgi:hypothetical protein
MQLAENLSVYISQKGHLPAKLGRKSVHRFLRRYGDIPCNVESHRRIIECAERPDRGSGIFIWLGSGMENRPLPK